RIVRAPQTVSFPDRLRFHEVDRYRGDGDFRRDGPHGGGGSGRDTPDRLVGGATRLRELPDDSLFPAHHRADDGAASRAVYLAVFRALDATLKDERFPNSDAAPCDGAVHHSLWRTDRRLRA